METIDLHTHYLPSAFVDTLRRGGRWHGWELDRGADGKEVLRSDAGLAPFPLAMADEAWDVRIRRRKDEGGIDRQVVMLPAFLWNYHLTGADGAAFCRDVNDEASSIQRAYDGSVSAMGVLPLQDRDRALAEVDRAVRELGIGVFSIGSHVEGRNLDDQDVQAILDAVCDAGAAIMIHASYFDRAGASRMASYDFGNSIGVPLEAGLSVMSLIYGGLFDRHPDARVGCCHGGGWVAYGIGRLWLRYTQGRDGGHLQRPPAEYLPSLHYDCLLHDEASFDLLVHRVGAYRVVIGTDHPYKGDMPGGAVAWIEGLGSLDSDQRRAILGGNARTFLGLESP